jgi:hypothetical protein
LVLPVLAGGGGGGAIGGGGGGAGGAEADVTGVGLVSGFL